jgi:hypothetical protein
MDNFSEDAFAGYIAGFLDGEGSIITAAHRYNHFIRIVLANTHEPTLLAIQKRLGFGNIHKRPSKNPKHKTLFVLYIDNFDRIEELLRMVRPYLYIKADKANEAFKVIDKRKASIANIIQRNESIINEINKGLPQTEIAKKYKMSQQNISCIKSGKTWPSRQKRYIRAR